MSEKNKPGRPRLSRKEKTVGAHYKLLESQKLFVSENGGSEFIRELIDSAILSTNKGGIFDEERPLCEGQDNKQGRHYNQRIFCR